MVVVAVQGALSSEVGSVRREAPSRVMLCRNVV